MPLRSCTLGAAARRVPPAPRTARRGARGARGGPRRLAASAGRAARIRGNVEAGPCRNPAAEGPAVPMAAQGRLARALLYGRSARTTRARWRKHGTGPDPRYRQHRLDARELRARPDDDDPRPGSVLRRPGAREEHALAVHA